MNSPPGGAPGPPFKPFNPVRAEAITRKLLAAIKEMEEATPEPENWLGDRDRLYDNECRFLRGRFEPHLVDVWRKKVAYPEYWEAECKQYQEALHELLQKKAQASHRNNAAQALAMSYQRILRRNGVSSATLSKIRDSIKDQRYWELETQVLEYQATIRTEKAEARIILQLDQEGRWPWPLPSPCRELLRPTTPRRARPNPPQRAEWTPPTDGGIASRTRSKASASLQRGMAKRVSRRHR